MTVASLFGFEACDGSGSSSTDEEGVKGSAALCESGLDGSDEDNKGGDLRDRERDDDVGRGGSGTLNDLKGDVSSEISSSAVLSSLGMLLRARRRCALVVGICALKFMESGSSSRVISKLPVEIPRILAGMGFIPFSRVCLSLA